MNRKKTWWWWWWCECWKQDNSFNVFKIRRQTPKDLVIGMHNSWQWRISTNEILTRLSTTTTKSKSKKIGSYFIITKIESKRKKNGSWQSSSNLLFSEYSSTYSIISVHVDAIACSHHNHHYLIIDIKMMMMMMMCKKNW